MAATTIHPAAARSATPPATCLEHYDAFECRVLPALFERLDRAFPEFAWTRRGHHWQGRLEQQGRMVPVTADQPWGFVLPDGRLVSWFAYLHRGAWPTADQLAAAVDRLAERAGVRVGRYAAQLDRGDREAIAARARRRELLEAFAAHTEWLLRQGVAADARAILNRDHGIDPERLAGLPLGLYTTQRAVCGHLEGLGFTADELTAARVMRDERLSGRLIVAWRDRHGRIQTIVARQLHRENRHGEPRTLYWKQGATREPFGIDAAARRTFRQTRHWVVVEGLLEAVCLRQQGLDGVIAFGDEGKPPTAAQWEMLTECGADQVTLALAGDAAGRKRTLTALETAFAARRLPQCFVVPPDSWGPARGPATLARLQGPGHLRAVLQRRWHALRYAADAIVREHRPGSEWTDAGLVAAIQQAVDYDARVFRPERALELGRFFWPTILQETGADWNVLRDLLRRRGVETKRRLSPELRLKGPYHKLVYELRTALQDHDTERCEELIRTAAGKLGIDPRQLRDDLEGLRGRSWNETPRQTQSWLYVSPEETTTYQVTPPESKLTTSCAVPVKSAARAAANGAAIEPPPVVEHTRGIDIDWLNRVLASSAVPVEQPPVTGGPVTQSQRPAPPVDLNLAAYLLWEQKGRPEGREQECWYEAERALRSA